MLTKQNNRKNSAIIGLFFLLLSPCFLTAQEETEWGDFEEWDEEMDTGPEDISAGSFPFFGYVELRSSLHFREKLEEVEGGYKSRFRLKGEWSPSDSITARMELLYEQNVGMSNSLTVLGSYGINPYPMVQAENPQDTFIENFEIDHAWAVVNLGNFDLSFGKLPLAWGSAYLYNPTDRLTASTSLQDRDAETPGTLALIPVWYPGGMWSVEGALVGTQRGIENKALVGSADPANIPFGVKVKGAFGSMDLAVSAIKEVWYTGASGGYVAPGLLAESWDHTYLLGVDLSGPLGPISWYLESTMAAPRDGNNIDFSAEWCVEETLELAGGIDYDLGSVSVKNEYIYHGGGREDKDSYLIAPLLSGRSFFLGRHYLFLHLSGSPGDFSELSGGGILNLSDLSFTTFVEVSVSMMDNLEALFSVSIPWGDEGTEYRGLFDPGTGDEIDLFIPEVGLSLKASF